MLITVRRAATDDISEIQALARRIWEEAYREILSKEQIDYMLEMMYAESTIAEEISNGVIWEIISDSDIPCGFISYSSADDHSVKLSKIYIDKDHRGKSIPTEAIKRVFQFAARNAKKRVFLTVNRKNLRAVRAYEKNGFTISSSVITDIGNGFVMDDYIMQCLIDDKC